MFRSWRFVSTNKLVAFALAFIFFLGLFFRLYRLSEMTGWYDSARDYMVGQELGRIFFDEKFKIMPIAPLAAGSVGALQNSPAYYYFVAVLIKLFSTPMAVASFVATLSSLTILINYLIGKRLGGDHVGLVSAFFTAISFVLINHSITLVQPNFLPFFVSSFILAALLAYEKKSFFWSLISIFVFWISFHLHYSILLITPVFLWSFWQVGKRISQTTNSKLKLLYLGCVFICLALIWYALTNVSSEFDLLNFMFGQISQGVKISLHGLLLKIVGAFFIFWSSYFWHLNHSLVSLILLGMSVLLVVDHLRKRSISQNNFLKIFLNLVFISVGFLAIFNRKLDESYFVIIYTIVPLILARFFQMIMEWRPMVGLLFLVVMSSWLNLGNERLANAQVGPFVGSKLVAEQILADMNNKNLTDIKKIFVASRSPELPVYDWTSPKYWYFLEKQTGQKNTTLSHYFNNLTWNSDDPRIFYLVCEGYDLAQIEEVELDCLTPYLTKLNFIFEPKIEEMVLDGIGVKVFILQIKSGISSSHLWPFRVVDMKKID